MMQHFSDANPLPVSSYTSLEDHLSADRAEKALRVRNTNAGSESFSGTPIMEKANASNKSVSVETVMVSISSTFQPEREFGSSKPDQILLSSDRVNFYVHSLVLKCQSVLRGLLSVQEKGSNDLPTIKLSDHSSVVNILLHTIYNLPWSQFQHHFNDVVTAIDRMPSYGLNPKEILTPSHPLHEFVLSQAPLYPTQAYALAARHNVESLAVASSSYLLSTPIANISDELATSIGPKYLKRLFLLHYHRQQGLRELLLCNFYPHPVTKDCDFGRQQDVNRAWILTSAYLTLSDCSDVTPQRLGSTLRTLIPLIECPQCRQAVEDKIKNVVIRWSLSKNTI